MKKFHQWLIGISLMGMLVSGIASASFQGGSVAGVSAADLLDYFKLTAANVATGLNRFTGQTQLEGPTIATNDVKVDITDTATNGVRRGVEIKNNEVGSMCIGPSDGQSRSYCLSSNLGVVKLEGGSGTLYDTNTAAHVGLQWNYGGAAPSMMLNQGGTVSVAAGNFLVPETALTVGSNTRAASTFLVDATNDWTKHLPIAAPAAGECDAAAEKGRLYFDSTANEFKYCNGTAWTSFGGGGGGPTTTLSTFTNNSDHADIYSNTKFRLSWVETTRRMQMEVLTLPGGTQAGSVDNVGVDISCNYTSGTYIKGDQTEMMATGSTVDVTGSIQSNDDGEPAQAFCQIKAMEDESWGFYEVNIMRAAKASSSTDGRLYSIKTSEYSY